MARPHEADADPAATAFDKTTRALLALALAMDREQDEAELLRAALACLLEPLEASGGAVWLAGADTGPTPGVRHGEDCPDPAVAALLAREAQESASARVRPLARGGWLAAASLGGIDRGQGALALWKGGEGGTAPETALVAGTARQVGIALERLRLSRELRATSARLDLLHRLTLSVGPDMGLAAAVPACASEIAGVLDFDRLACGFVNEAGDYLEVTGHPAGSGWGFGPVHPVVGSGPGSVLLNGEALLEPDLLHHHRFIEDMRLLDEGIRSYLLLPLNARGRVIGVLALGSSRPGCYDEGAVGRLLPLADAAALTLDNVRLLHKTRELSITDEVTPLYNFRFFHQSLERELKMVDRYRSCLSLIFLDLDRFKPINDRYGHLRGSRVLREVGFLLRAHVRDTDYPARYGGDEFVIILPQTDRPAAETLAGKLRRVIEGHRFLQEEGIDARIGVSLGVATYPAEAGSKDDLIRLADKRMYSDKEMRSR